MNIPCESCGRLFGGQETFNRHLLKREDRCRTEGEMKAVGLYSDIAGIWRRTGSRTATGQAPLIDRRTAGHLTPGQRRQRFSRLQAEVAAASKEQGEGTDTEALRA